MSTDIHQIFAVLHKALLDAENSHTTLHLFGEFSAEQCLKAHDILRHLDLALKAQWSKKSGQAAEGFV